MGYINVQECINIGRRASKIRIDSSGKKVPWKTLGRILEKNEKTVKRYCLLYQEGGEKAIIDYHEQAMNAQRSGHTKRKSRTGVRKGDRKPLITEAWKSDFKHQPLFNRVMNINLCCQN